jgi:Uma2 family endonuclease
MERLKGGSMVQEIKPETQTKFVTKPLKMSYEEFLEWADEDTYAEWVDGEVIYMSPVSDRHQFISGFLLSLMRFFVETKNLGVVLFDPFQMKTAPHLNGRAPNILFVTNENLSRLKKNYLEGPADLVIEIISPESRSRDRGEKFYEYEEGGVPEYWLIDPIRKQAEFYHLSEDGIYHVMPVDEQGIFCSYALDGLWLKVDWLWQEPLPTLISILKQWQLV